VGLAVSACGVRSGSSGSSSSSSGPDVAYFHGKTITMIAPDNPGGSFDQWSRLVAPAMGKYLGATVNVENIPAGNTVVGQNTLAAAQPNGLTIGWLNGIEDIGFSINAGSQGINFNPTDEDMIAAPGQNITVWVTNPSSNLTSWQSIVKSTTPVSTLDVTSGTADLYLRALYGAYGVKSKLITGYESSKLLAAGFLRHDAPVAEEEFTVFEDAISAGEARPVLLSNPASASNPADKDLLKIPTVAQMAKEFPPKTTQEKAALQEVLALVSTPGNLLTAPKGTPTGEVQALQAAAHAALTSASVEQQAQKEGLTPGYFSGAQCLQDYKDALAHVNILKPLMTSS
jgi:tripartite-type tricarboxylate transporter receptor subunit TctC